MESLFKLSVIVNMIDNITQPMSAATRSLSGMNNTIAGLDSGFKTLTKGGLAMVGMGAGITTAALSPVSATFETRKALGQLSSLGIKDLEALEEAAKNFSDTWAGTSKAEFISAAYDIKSGIASLSDEGVAQYTELAGVTAKATKASVGEMTSLFATGYGIYKDYYSSLSDVEFGEMFSAGIAKSVQQFKTDGSQMAGAIQTLGASATTSNVPLEEQLSILGMLQATMSGSEAGTKYKAFLQSAAKAGDELGLSFTDANNQLLSMPEILAALKGKFGETMDAAEKLELQKAFGTQEAVALIDLLYNKTGDLETNIISLYDTMGQGKIIAGEMATAINSAEGEKLDVLKQRVHNTVEEIGNGMLPAVNEWLDKGANLLDHISTWIGDNQQLVTTIMMLITKIGVILTILGVFNTTVGVIGSTVVGLFTGFLKLKNGLSIVRSGFETLQIKALYAGDSIKAGFLKIKSATGTVISSIGNVTRNIFSMAKAAAINGFNALKSMAIGMFNMAKQAIITAATAMPGLIASVWSFTAALLANPITWIVVGVIALIAALILLWQNWDAVVAWVKGAWSGAVQFVSNAFNGLVGAIGNIGASLFNTISNLWNSVVSSVTGFGSRIHTSVMNIWNNVKNGVTSFVSGWIPNMLQSGKKVISTFCEGIRSMIGKPAELVKQGLAKVRKLLPFSDAKEGPLSRLTLSGSKVFSTIGEGMKKTMNVPASIASTSFQNINAKMGNELKKKDYVLSDEQIGGRESGEEETKKDSGTVIKIGTLSLPVDLKSLKDLKVLLQLVEELEDQYGKQTDDVPEDEIILE